LTGAPLFPRSPVSFFFSSRRRHTRFSRDWSSDVCSSDLARPWRGRPAHRDERASGRKRDRPPCGLVIVGAGLGLKGGALFRRVEVGRASGRGGGEEPGCGAVVATERGDATARSEQAGGTG